MSSCFCAVAIIGQDPNGWLHMGCYCNTTNPMQGSLYYNMPQPLGPPEPAPCSCAHPYCQPASLVEEEDPELSSFARVYEEGVPNPRNPLSAPDQPAQFATVIGEYTADFRLYDHTFK